MAKSSRGRGRKSSGTRHSGRAASKTTRSHSQRVARRITLNNCIRKRGRLARIRAKTKKENTSE